MEVAGGQLDPRVPVTILTGFLGSGKTTLLNHILTATHGRKIAIIENEYGDTAIDDALIKDKNSKFHSDEEIVEVLNGCICCSVRQDLVDFVLKLAARTKAGHLCLDAIVIETTGLADPAPVAQTFLVDPEVREYARLDGIVTLIDAVHIEAHLDEEKPDGVVNEAAAQLAFADRLLLNKTDLVSSADLPRIEARLRAVNAFAPIERCAHGQVSVKSVLNIRGFDLQRALKISPEILNPNAPKTLHDARVGSVSLDQSAPRHLRLVNKGALNIRLMQQWVSELLQSAGDIFRMKGVLSIAHAEQRFVYHSVHMLFNGGFAAPWAEGEARESKMVFIGKNLNAEALADRFNACLETPETRARQLEALRFAIGDEVECNVDNEWCAGTVVAHLYRNEWMEQGMVAPYQVKLDQPLPDDDGLIFAPADIDECIRRRRGRDVTGTRPRRGRGSG